MHKNYARQLLIYESAINILVASYTYVCKLLLNTGVTCFNQSINPFFNSEEKLRTSTTKNQALYKLNQPTAIIKSVNDVMSYTWKRLITKEHMAKLL